MIEKKHIPNLLTYSRVAVIPLFLLSQLLGEPLCWIVMFGLFVFASITDFLDGYLSRKWEVTSNIGRALDPVADKLLVAIALLVLLSEGRAPIVAVSIILCRELWVAGLREALAGATVIHVSKLAKWKTATQMVAISVLLLAGFLPLVAELGVTLLWVGTILTALTGWQYSVACLKALR